MCYNSKCKIEIKSCIDGVQDIISAKGRVIKSHSDISFDYTLDGDSCTLTITDGEVVQDRRGEQSIKLTFRKGEKTECFLKNGGFLGTFPVFTHDLQCTMCDINRKIGAIQVFILSIVYTIGEQKIELNFSAEYKLKEKR